MTHSFYSPLIFLSIRRPKFTLLLKIGSYVAIVKRRVLCFYSFRLVLSCVNIALDTSCVYLRLLCAMLSPLFLVTKSCYEEFACT
jgi:hypothetical protein